MSTYKTIAKQAGLFSTLYTITEYRRAYGSREQVVSAVDQETTAYNEMCATIKNSLSLSELIRLTLAKMGAIQAGREKMRRSDLHAGIGALPASATLLAGLTIPPGFSKES